MTATTTTEEPAAPQRPGAGVDATPAEIIQLRERIDEIDTTMIALWQERASLSQRVGAVRVANGGTRLALSREREILEKFSRELGSVGTQLALLILRAGRGPL